jgi:hypothetical protein
MTKTTSEKRKRRTEEFACNEDRTIQLVRAKFAKKDAFTRSIMERMNLTSDGFLSQIPLHVMYDFVRSGQRLEVFLFNRNAHGQNDDIPWLSPTTQYQEAVKTCLDHSIKAAVRRLEPLKTLREYRHARIPLTISAYPARLFKGFARQVGKPLSLPAGSYVYVDQVLSNGASIRLSISSQQEDIPDQQDNPNQLCRAWDLIAGTRVLRPERNDPDTFDEIEMRADDWMDVPSCDPETFQSALSCILKHWTTNSPFVLSRSGDSCRLRLRASADEMCYRRVDFVRSIGFEFSSEIVKQTQKLSDSVHFPLEVHTCIAGYL